MSSKLVKGTLKSAWTPLSHGESNAAVFEERRALMNRWFEMWSTSQRKTVLEDLLLKCTGTQVEYAKSILSTKAIQNHVDFTRSLPRVLCLYIFSYLDPRSLCRASQVCWYWKYLSEANEIWAPKCAKLGWYFSGTLNSMESGFWKRQFIDNIHYLQVTRPAKEKARAAWVIEELTKQELAKQAEREELLRKAKRLKDKHLQGKNQLGMPWRGPDPKPIDIVRNNYIDNDEDNGSKIKEMRLNSKHYSRRVSNDLKLNGITKENGFKNLRPYSAKNHPSSMTMSNQDQSSMLLFSSNDRIQVLSSGIQTNVVTDDNGQRYQKDNNFTNISSEDIPSGRPWTIPVDQDEL